jgi:hypothetical protein
MLTINLNINQVTLQNGYSQNVYSQNVYQYSTKRILTKRILTQCILIQNVCYTKTYTNIRGFALSASSYFSSLPHAPDN